MNYEQLAQDREQEERDEKVAQFVGGSVRQKRIATEWLVGYLEASPPEQGALTTFLKRLFNASASVATGPFHTIPVGSTAKVSPLRRAVEFLQLLQAQPREATVEALGAAAVEQACFWELLCVGLQGYSRSADSFFLAADAARVAVPRWDTPTAVLHLKKALKPIELPLDTFAGQTILELTGTLTAHPALRQLVPDLKTLEHHAALKASCQELCSQILAQPKSDFPIPTKSHEHPDEDLPIPVSERKEG